MRKLFFAIASLLFISISYAQNVGIGTTTPANSALLEINSTNKGILLPRLNDTNLVTNPVEGLFIYNKNAKTPFFHDGVKWQRLNITSSPASATADSVTYTLSGLGNPIELPATSVSHSASSNGPSTGSTIAFSKRADVNTLPIHQKFFANTPFTSIEFKYYKPGATTPTQSIKLRNVSLLSNSYGFLGGQGGGLSDESYMISYSIYGFKDWTTGTSFGFDLTTNTMTTY